MKSLTATIADVKRELALTEAAIAKDPSLEGLIGKKLGSAVDLIKIKDGVTKDLNQAYTHSEKKWAVNFANDLDSCNKANKLEKIKQYVCGSLAYTRLFADPATKAKVEDWLSEKFKAKAEQPTVEEETDPANEDLPAVDANAAKESEDE